MASVEPSTNHLVMSPLWMTRELMEDRGKRTINPSVDGEEASSMEARRKRGVLASLLRWFRNGEEFGGKGGVVPTSREPLLKMLVIWTLTTYCPVWWTTTRLLFAKSKKTKKPTTTTTTYLNNAGNTTLILINIFNW